MARKCVLAGKWFAGWGIWPLSAHLTIVIVVRSHILTGEMAMMMLVLVLDRHRFILFICYVFLK